MIDTKKHLLGIHCVGQGVEAIMLLLAPLQPPKSALAGGLGVLIGSGVLHALIEGHSNIAAQIRLDLHALLGAHKNTVTIKVRGESHALFIDLTKAGQGKHLKSTAVGKDRAIPVHELMETTHLTHHIVTGTEMEMIGVAQLDLTAQLLFQIKGIHAALNGSLCADIHKYRGLHFSAVSALKHAATGFSLFFDDFEHICHLA